MREVGRSTKVTSHSLGESDGDKNLGDMFAFAGRRFWLPALATRKCDAHHGNAFGVARRRRHHRLDLELGKYITKAGN